MIFHNHQALDIVLASTSPRRHELLNQVHISHTRLTVSIDETQLPDENPVTYIERMVDEKANAALPVLDAGSKSLLIITADTIGVLDNGEVLQKPMDLMQAKAMWRQMSGTTHEVWTAVQVTQIQKQGNALNIVQKLHQTVKTEVEFIALTDDMMMDYWQTGEPQDKAGGYAIQGQGAAWVKAINGSYTNVVGLPLVETIDLLNKILH